MTDYSFKNDIKSITFVINQLVTNPNLNKWEKGFIKDVKKYNDDGGFLSVDQLKVLSRMWEQY